jgi:hypothetical protein
MKEKVEKVYDLPYVWMEGDEGRVVKRRRRWPEYTNN